jgi:hypothetical protein
MPTPDSENGTLLAATEKAPLPVSTASTYTPSLVKNVFTPIANLKLELLFKTVPIS